MKLPRKPRLVEVILFASLIFLFAFLAFARPPLVFLTLLLAPIALAAVLYEFASGALLALAVMIGVALLVAKDPDTYRRATMLQEVWPILVAYLAVGPLVGSLASQERERQLQLTATTHRLDMVQESIQAINNSVDPQETLQAIIAETRHSSSTYLAGVRPRDIAVNKAYQCEQGQNYTMIVSEVVLLATISWSVRSIDNLLGIF